MAEEEPIEIHLIVEPEQMAGVWANWVEVCHSEHEFTLDFLRLDHSVQPPRQGIVVARVAVSALLVTQLIDALQADFSAYAAKAMPKEVDGADGPEEDEIRPEEG